MADGQGTPLWWVRRLDARLAKRGPVIATYNNYYGGEQNLLFASTRFKREFGKMLRNLRDNWCELVVDAVEERLNIEGFKFGEDSEDANKDAWFIWQRNHMDTESQMAHVESLVAAESCALAWSDPKNPGTAIITVERADQAIVAYSEDEYRERAAGLKRWVSTETEKVYATLYLPDKIMRFQAPFTEVGLRSDGTVSYDPKTITWSLRGEENEAISDNPVGVVPLVPLTNRPRIGKPGRSEIANVMPIQDAVNKMLADMMISSEFSSFRQRWGTGIEIPVDPETNKPIEPFKAAIDHLWTSQSPEARFGDFEQTDLTTYVTAMEMLIQHIASQTRTPPHYFYLTGQFPSGESIKSAETGLVAKTFRKQRFFGDTWEEIERISMKIEDKVGKDAPIIETIWRDPESRSESEHVDALVKLKSINVPDEQLWSDAGYTPTQIAEFKRMREEQPDPAPVLSIVSPNPSDRPVVDPTGGTA